MSKIEKETQKKDKEIGQAFDKSNARDIGRKKEDGIIINSYLNWNTLVPKIIIKS